MRHAWPVTGERTARVVIASLIGALAIALAGCGAEDGATAATTAAATGNTSASSSAPTPTSGTTSETSKGSGSTATTTTTTTTTTATSPVSPPPKAATTSSITLGWIPPTQNSDGTPITSLAGYKIHYGTNSSEYTQTIALANAGLTRYVVDNLSSGTYYFAITAYNSQGVESSMSGEVSSVVN